MITMQPYYIYNSRNYKCLIDAASVPSESRIYNSRNYKCLIDDKQDISAALIYNSRNYKCLIDCFNRNRNIKNLQ